MPILELKWLQMLRSQKSGDSEMIKNKQEWYKYFQTTIFNRPNNYPVSTFLKKCKQIPENEYALRSISKIGGGKFIVFPSKNFICKHILENAEFQNDSAYQVTEKMPDDKIIIQGNYDGIVAEVTTAKQPMGVLTRSPRYEDWHWPVMPRVQLKEILGVWWEYLNDVHDAFSCSLDVKYSPVIEFSYYSYPVGIHREPFIIWEIRNY